MNRGVPEFAGLKITQDRWAAGKYGALRFETLRRKDQLVLSPKGFIGWGGNSGFQALNVAVQLGASRVVLVGFDLSLDGGLHWHGAHRGRLNNPTTDSLRRWAAVLDDQASLLADHGVEVVNASARSALTAYPKMSLKDALAC